ncbi:MAG: hypothetical protein KJ630_05500 [Proteobacteria bacterium]|nr:hypothetical protein [Pseudomonadota bacterium]
MPLSLRLFSIQYQNVIDILANISMVGTGIDMYPGKGNTFEKFSLSPMGFPLVPLTGFPGTEDGKIPVGVTEN